MRLLSDNRLRLAARLYYLDGLGQSAVSRRLALAKERGLVRITVADYDPPRRELEDHLRPRLGLAIAIVIKASESLEGADLRRTVGHFGAPAVDALIASRDIVRHAGGRTIPELAHHHLPVLRT